MLRARRGFGLVVQLSVQSLALALSALSTSAQQAPPVPSPSVPPSAYAAMEWRLIGPFRGGRVTAVAGVPGDPLTFFMGATGGGVWKTEDAGLTWRNVSDGFMKTSSVGAIAVAESDRSVVYVGMGEAPVRGVATSHGDGVYKSTDGGKTWTHVGLEKTRHISMIQVDPRNADVVFVAAQGSPFGPNPERGVYRSLDGGRAWTRVHTVNDTTGACDLAMDATNPRVLYAAYWDHQRLPWMVRSGGPGSGVFKTTDSGETWTRLSSGLPKGVMGKVAVSVSRADPDRVYALIESDEGGLHRSDDAGGTWRRVNDDRQLRARAWYYINVFADPQSADVVYVLNAPFLKSVDGGRTFTAVATPHGDNHALWIDPTDGRRMINGNDGGANVSHNGGRSWSAQGNQPTAQFYRVNTDRRFPFWVYGGQQDNTSVAIASRSSGAGIDETEWHAVGGCESAHVAFDPDAPDLVYAGCYQGIITEWDRRTKQARNVMAYTALGLGEPSDQQKHRFNWNAPILVSMHDPAVIYHAGNVLFRSRDRGQSWTPISPDLTRNEKRTQGPGGGPITNEGAGGEVYNTILAVAESPHDARTMYVGTDDGLVHVTRDGGATWSNVTPKGIGEFQVNSLEVSPHDPATAYAAITGYKRNDFTPHLFKTTDHGRTWMRLVEGLPDGSFVRVVREDPIRRDLLYAGTETGAHVSFDGGRHWQPLQLNLPVVPVTDLQARKDALVASTQGRAFWVLDDLSPVRQYDAAIAKAPAHLYVPQETVRFSGGGNRRGTGTNPPSGAVLFYSLADEPKAPITLEILDPKGTVLRSFTSAEQPAAPGTTAPPPRLPAKGGLNRFVWDLRAEPIPRVAGLFVNGDTSGYRVAPGRYQVRLKSGDTVLTQPLLVRRDPRVTITDEDEAARQRLATAVTARVGEIHAAVARLREIREQVKAIATRAGSAPRGAEVGKAAAELTAKITSWEEAVVTPAQKTFQDVINFRNRLNAHYLFVLEVLDDDGPPTGGVTARLADLDAEWATRRAELSALTDRDVPAFNRLLQDAGVPTVGAK